VIIALANSKGGVGKTTIAVHLAVRAHELGRRVAVIDADVLECSGRWIANLENPPPVFRLKTADDVIEQYDRIAQTHELVIVDGPGGSTEMTRALLMICNLALLPCGPSTTDWRAFQDALRLVRQAQKIRGGTPGVLLIPNRLQAGYRLSKELRDAVAKLDVPAVEGMRLRQAYADADGQNTVVWHLPKAEDASKEFLLLYDQIHDHETKARLH
jgi:chromosome partitioning protein